MKAILIGALCITACQLAPTAIAGPYDVCLPAVEQAVTTQYRIQSSDARKAVRDAVSQQRTENVGSSSSGGGTVGLNLFEVVGVSVGGSSSSSKVSQISDRYKRDSTLAISDEDFLYTLTTIENPIVANLARDCIRAVGLTQGSFRYTLNDVNADDFSITYHYVPQVSTDPTSVRVSNLTVSGAARVETPLTIASGLVMEAYAGYTQRFSRTAKDEAAIVQLDVEGRPALPVTVAAKEKYDPLPVGMVIASPLPWGQFAQLSGDSAAFSAHRNKWAPCDGRSVAGSALATGGVGISPDLRGVFVRGLNDFAAGDVPPVDPARADPEQGRRATDFQDDGFEAHTHSLGYYRWGLANGEGDANLERAGHSRPLVDSGPAGGAETRPKNVALYYYVKIN